MRAMHGVASNVAHESLRPCMPFYDAMVIRLYIYSDGIHPSIKNQNLKIEINIGGRNNALCCVGPPRRGGAGQAGGGPGPGPGPGPGLRPRQGIIIIIH